MYNALTACKNFKLLLNAYRSICVRSLYVFGVRGGCIKLIIELMHFNVSMTCPYAYNWTTHRLNNLLMYTVLFPGKLTWWNFSEIPNNNYEVTKNTLLKPLFKYQSETLNFHPLTLNQIANGFLHCTLWIFSFKNLGPVNLHTPLHTFQMFGPPLSDVGATLLASFSKVWT